MDKNQTSKMMKMEQKVILKVTPHSHNTIFMSRLPVSLYKQLKLDKIFWQGESQ